MLLLNYKLYSNFASFPSDVLNGQQKKNLFPSALSSAGSGTAFSCHVSPVPEDSPVFLCLHNLDAFEGDRPVIL